MTLHLTSCERVPFHPASLVASLMRRHATSLSQAAKFLRIAKRHPRDPHIRQIASNPMASAKAVRSALSLSGFDDEAATLALQAGPVEAEYAALMGGAI